MKAKSSASIAGGRSVSTWSGVVTCRATAAARAASPLLSDLEAALPSATKAGVSFDLSVVNVDGSSSGVITLVAGTGWTLVGLMTVVATAGTAQLFRARQTGLGAQTKSLWALKRDARAQRRKM